MTINQLIEEYAVAVSARFVAASGHRETTADEDDRHRKAAEALDRRLLRLLDAEELMEYLDNCGCGGHEVRFVPTRDRDGVRQENRDGALWIWVNESFGDPDRSSYIEGENISDALRESLRLQSRVPTPESET